MTEKAGNRNRWEQKRGAFTGRKFHSSLQNLTDRSSLTPWMALKKRSADLESGSADQLAFYDKKHKASGDNDCLMGSAARSLGKTAYHYICRTMSLAKNCFRVISHQAFFVTLCFMKMNQSELKRETYRNICSPGISVVYRNTPRMCLTELLYNGQTQTTSPGFVTSG